MPRSIKDLFNGALDQAPHERGAWLDAACGDDETLRTRVQKLLEAYQEHQDFLDTRDASPDEASSPSLPPNVPAGTVGQIIDRFKLLQLIGEGGFGEVWMAEQQHPVRRRVALKIIKLGMDTRQVIARFEAERQALAMMDHPNIAKVLDAGATESGRPYFVMELVKGDPITDYCDANSLTIDQRFELFVQVCQAVQHAHQKGIIHRDIKASNVLVSTQDGRALAKVIDFGIAKATEHRLTEKTLFTEFRQLIGTPQYMSPEQASGSLDIDTRSDVYSLGVLLYELLTGTTPFDAAELRSAAYEEMQRIIREVEPPKPSTRLSQSVQTLPSIAARRQVEPRKLGLLLRGEIDWIVMKAMDKDRARRYATANDLAADVARHLNGEPVVAAPPSVAYRLRKFVQKHRVTVIATSAVVAALLLGISLASIFMLKARQEAQRATGEAERARASESRLRAQQEKVASGLKSMGLKPVGAGTISVNITDDDGRTRYSSEKTYGSNADGDLDLLVLRATLALAEAEGAKVQANARAEEAELAAYTANIGLAQAAMSSGAWAEARRRLNDCPKRVRAWEWEHLRQKSSQVFMQFGNPVEFAEFDRSGAGIVSLEGLRADLHDPLTGKLLATCQCDQALITEFSADRRLALASPARTTTDLSTTTTQMFGAGSSTRASLCDVPTGRIRTSFDHRSMLCSAAMTPDSSRVVTVGFDGSVTVWDGSIGEKVVSFNVHNRPANAVISDDGLRVLTTTRTDAAIWDASTGHKLGSLQYTGKLQSAWFARNGVPTIATLDAHTAKLLDVTTGREMAVFQSIGQPTRATFSADASRVLVVTDYNKSATVWEVATGRRLGTMTDVEGGSISRDGRIALLDPRGEANLRGLEVVDIGTFDTVSIKIECEDDQKSLELAAGLGESEPVAAPEPCTKAISRDLRWSATITDDGLVSITDTRNNKTRTFSPHGGGVRTVVFSPDSSRLLTAGTDASITYWDPESSRELAVIHHSAVITGLRFSTDGTRLAICDANQSVEVWDTRSPEMRQKDRDARLVEHPAAKAYIDALWAGPTPTEKLAGSVRADGALSILRRAVALELLLNRMEETQLAAYMRREALARVHVTPPRVRRAAEADTSLPPREKAALLAAVDGWKPDTPELSDLVWGIVGKRGAPAEQLAAALEGANLANQLEPTVQELVETLGIAQYRSGEFELASRSLEKAIEMGWSSGSNVSPSTRAAFAISRYRLGERDAARQVMQELKMPDVLTDIDRELLAEAEELMGPLPATGPTTMTTLPATQGH